MEYIDAREFAEGCWYSEVSMGCNVAHSSFIWLLVAQGGFLYASC